MYNQKLINIIVEYALITYLLGLFYLNQILLYLSPLEDPEEMDFDTEYILPIRYNSIKLMKL